MGKNLHPLELKHEKPVGLGNFYTSRPI